MPFLEYPDGFSISQSNAIARHIAREHNLYGKDGREAARADMIADGALDLHRESRTTVNNVSIF